MLNFSYKYNRPTQDSVELYSKILYYLKLFYISSMNNILLTWSTSLLSPSRESIYESEILYLICYNLVE